MSCMIFNVFGVLRTNPAMENGLHILHTPLASLFSIFKGLKFEDWWRNQIYASYFSAYYTVIVNINVTIILRQKNGVTQTPDHRAVVVRSSSVTWVVWREAKMTDLCILQLGYVPQFGKLGCSQFLAMKEDYIRIIWVKKPVGVESITPADPCKSSIKDSVLGSWGNICCPWFP